MTWQDGVAYFFGGVFLANFTRLATMIAKTPTAVATARQPMSSMRFVRPFMA
jgi:hypothetical protein